MNALSQPFYGKGYAMESQMPVWDATVALQECFRSSGNELQRIVALTQNLAQFLESTRELYNDALAERDDAHRRLLEADARLRQVEHVVRRYAEVKDPVVANDGFTYERQELTKYLADCKNSNSKAYSQLTKEELTGVVVDNLSLTSLAEKLRGLHMSDLPQLTNRSFITGKSGHRGWSEEAGHRNDVMGAGAGGARGRPAMPVGIPPVGSAPTRRGEHGPKYAIKDGAKMALHPCVRVYGFCNFGDDCTFANYPFEACLNFIKGKCRFGATCKELHVDPQEPSYLNARSSANQSSQNAATEQPPANDSADRNGESTEASATPISIPAPASVQKKEAAKAPAEDKGVKESRKDETAKKPAAELAKEAEGKEGKKD